MLKPYFKPKAWFRAIYADQIPVGFVILFDDSEKPEYSLWRFIIDKRYKNLGFGREALFLIIEYVKTRLNAKEMYVSYHKREGSSEGFYKSLGFENTGRMEGEEQ